jgi:hypothetical protein
MSLPPLFALNLVVYASTALAVAAGVAIVIYFLFRNRDKRPAPPPPPSHFATTPDWEAMDSSFADRRSTLRREGRPVKILVASPSFKKPIEGGYVLDRSTGGMRIALMMAMTNGATMQVRAYNAPDNIPWVTVIVRNCRTAGQHFELGVEFDQTPPWNVLLLFG